MQLLTGISLDDGSVVFKYRPGSFVGLHNDYYLSEKKKTEQSTFYGNRFAQGLLFFSGTDLGGNFILPFLGIAVNPEPGSLVVWHNVDRKGSFDPR